MISGGGYTIVGKARLQYKYGDSGDCIEFGTANNSGKRMQLIQLKNNEQFSMHVSLKNNSGDTEYTSQARNIGGQVKRNVWIPVIYTISIDNSGKGTFKYFGKGTR